MTVFRTDGGREDTVSVLSVFYNVAFNLRVFGSASLDSCGTTSWHLIDFEMFQTSGKLSCKPWHDEGYCSLSSQTTSPTHIPQNELS